MTNTQRGYSHPKCYARVLKNCSRELTREHYLSKSLQELVFKDNKISMLQAPWLDEGEIIPASLKSSFVAKVLCKEHNNALTDLDTLAKDFYKFLIGEDAPHRPTAYISGTALECWLLKIYCGYASTGIIPYLSKNWTPPIEWLRTLFSSAPMPQHLRLHYIVRNRTYTPPNQINLSLISNPEKVDTEALIGSFGPFDFLFSLAPLSEYSHPKDQRIELNCRPSYIHIIDDIQERTAWLCWGEGEGVLLRADSYVPKE